MELSIKTEQYSMGMLLHKTMIVRGHKVNRKVLSRLLHKIADARLRGEYHEENEFDYELVDDNDNGIINNNNNSNSNSIKSSQRLMDGQFKESDPEYDSGYDMALQSINRNKVVVVNVDVGVDAARTSVLTAIRSQKRRVNSGGVFNDLLVVIGTLSMSSSSSSSSGASYNNIINTTNGSADDSDNHSHSDSDDNKEQQQQQPPRVRQSLYKLLREELQLEVTSTSSARVLSSPNSNGSPSLSMNNVPRPVAQIIRDMVIFEILIVKKAALIDRFKSK